MRRGVKQRLATEFLISAKPKPRFRVQVNKAIRSLLRRTTVRDSRCCPLGVAVVVPRRRRGVSRVRSRRRGAEVRHSRRVNRDARGIDTRTRRARGRRGLPARTRRAVGGDAGKQREFGTHRERGHRALASRIARVASAHQSNGIRTHDLGVSTHWFGSRLGRRPAGRDRQWRGKDAAKSLAQKSQISDVTL